MLLLLLLLLLLLVVTVLRPRQVRTHCQWQAPIKIARANLKSGTRRAGAGAGGAPGEGPV